MSSFKDSPEVADMFDKQQIAMLQTSFQNMSFLISVLHVQCERKNCSAVALNLFSSAVMVASNSSQNFPNSIFLTEEMKRTVH